MCLTKQETDQHLQKVLVDENAAVNDKSAQECVKEVTACEADTSAVKEYVIDLKQFEAAKEQVEELTKQLTNSMKIGEDKCKNLSQELKDSKSKVRKQRDDIEKSKRKLKHALGDAEDQVAINLKQEKKLAAANEVENKLNKQILELLKSAPAVSKPVNTSSDWYTGYGKAPIVSLVSDDKEENLRKLI